MKIYILGSNGMLGTYLHRYIKDSIGLTRKDIDASLITELEDTFDKIGFEENDVIINAMGITNKRNVSDHLFYSVNAMFPILLSNYCSSHGLNLIHISTDCVFSGKQGGYIESDTPDATDVYGISKCLGEKMEHTVIRTSIIGECKTSKKDLLEWVRSHKNMEIKGYYTHFWNGVTCLQLAKICKHIIKHKLYWKGVRHIFTPISVSKYALVYMINTIYELGNTVEAVSMDFNDKSLGSIYPGFNVTTTLYKQIKEQKEFKL